MGDVIDLDSRRTHDDIPYLPIIESQDIPIIECMKSRIGTIAWFEYLLEMVSMSKKWKNIIHKSNISTNSLPYNISIQLDKITTDQKRQLGAEISNAMKSQKDVFIKEQLFYLRTKILQTITQW